jgi:hypothetical protein
MLSILPDVAPENAVKASLKADEMPPEFSFGYEADKKKAAEDKAQGSRNGESTKENSQVADDNRSESESDTIIPESLSPTSTPGSSPHPTSVSPALSVTEATAMTRGSSPSGPSATVAVASTTVLPTVPSKEQTTVATTAPSSPAAPTIGLVHYNPGQPQPTNPPMRAGQQTQHYQSQMQRTNSSPIWLDILIIGFGGVLVALVVKRLFM